MAFKYHLQIPPELSYRKASGGESCTLWDELKEHKAVSQKDSFQFSMEDMSFFTIAL